MQFLTKVILLFSLSLFLHTANALNVSNAFNEPLSNITDVSEINSNIDESIEKLLSIQSDNESIEVSNTSTIDTSNSSDDKYNLNYLLDNQSSDLSSSSATNNTTPFSYEVIQDKSSIEIKFTSKDGAYIYKDSLNISLSNGEFITSYIPEGTYHEDSQGTNVVFFNDELSIKLTILKSQEDSVLTVKYQGCDKNGICYPPASFTHETGAQENTDIVALESNQATNSYTVEEDKDNLSLAQKVEILLVENLLLGLALCFLLGITLDLTPCVLPMLPIFSVMILGGKKTSFSNTITKNISYSLGLSLTYMLFGVLFSFLGAGLNAYLQHSFVTITIAILLILCALSCAGLFEIKLPSKLTNYIQAKASSQTKGSFVSAFLFGAISATISTPCTSAPLAGALLFVLNSGDIMLGALAFLAIGLGMSFPLLLIGIFGPKFLPKNGNVSKYIKKLIAIPLLIAAYLIAQNVFVAYDIYALFLLLFIGLAYFIHITLELFNFDIKNLHRTTGICVAFIITFLIISNYNKNEHDSNIPSVFLQIDDIKAIKRYSDKPIIIEFYSDWCKNCKIMEKTVFTDPVFIEETKDYHRLKFDITNLEHKDVKKMIETYKLVGVPYVVVTNSKHEIKASQIGLADTEELLRVIKSAKD